MLFSPYFDQGACFLNLFEQGASLHQDIMTAFQGAAAMITPDVDPATVVMDSRNIVFCNYIVAKPSFWKVWLEKCELIFAEAEKNKTPLANTLNASTNHRNGVAPNKVFVIERIASLLLSTHPDWRVKAYDSTRLPYSTSPIAQYPLELLQMDELKIASVEQGSPEYLSRFLQIKQSVEDSIRKPREQDLQQAVNEVLQMANQHKNAGELEQAEPLYLEIIKIQPDHAEANHNLGVIETQTKGALVALPRFEIAVQNQPENEQFWVSYIDALMLSGAASTAIEVLELGQKYGLTQETAQMLAAGFSAELEEKTRRQQEQTTALQQTVIQALQLELIPGKKRNVESAKKLGDGKPVFYIWAPDYSEFSSGVKSLHLLCDRLNRLGHEAYMAASYVNQNLRTPIISDELKNQHKLAGRLQIAIYPEVQTGNPIAVPNVVRYLLNIPNKFLKTTWFGSFHQDEYVLHYDDCFTLPWIKSQCVYVPTLDRDTFKPPVNKHAARSGFLVYSHRAKPDLEIIPDWCKPFQVISMANPRSPKQLAELYQKSAGMIAFERTAAAAEAMLCGCPVIFSSNCGLEKSSVYYEGYKDYTIAWDFDQDGYRKALSSVTTFAEIYDNQVTSDIQALMLTTNKIITHFQSNEPETLETTPAYALENAEKLVQQGKIKEAILCYRQLIIDHPSNVEAYFRMGTTLINIGLPAAGLQTLVEGEVYLSQLPEHTSLDTIKAMYYEKLNMVAQVIGDSASARQSAERSEMYQTENA
jgi:tetratricopeptide (TPR) repeat protein